MSVFLPLCPYPEKRNPTLVDYGGLLGGTLGGPVQRLNRMGNRHTLDVSLPPGQAIGANEAVYRVYVSELKRGLTRGVILQFPQMSLHTTGSGTPVANGAGQAGSTLNLRGLTPGYVVNQGQFFSIIHGGRRYVHSSDEAATIGADGHLLIDITPMLRISPADGDTIEFDRPFIEGFVTGRGISWSTDYAYIIGISFAITEAQ